MIEVFTKKDTTIGHWKIARDILVDVHGIGRIITGICFTNLIDYDILYGHRNDVDGYALQLLS